MYLHMRPQSHELSLPSDLYRWRGVDGSEILTLRIAVGLYHTERDNIEERLNQGKKLALKLNRDVPVFWGLGNHGGGATREDLEKIDRFAAREERVEVVHSTPDRLYEALKGEAMNAPVVKGDLQRVFTGCYTSLARVKRRAQESLALLVQTESVRAASWWLQGQDYPHKEMNEAWRSLLLNDFHDILTGTCTEPAEKDALDLYGNVAEAARPVRLGAAVSFARLADRNLRASIPITVMNANPSLAEAPVEVEVMADYRPFWRGEWHLRLFGLDGREIASQEEQPEALLPFNRWRRKISFLAQLPGVGCSHFMAGAFEGRRKAKPAEAPKHELKYKIARNSGLIDSLDAGGRRPCLRGLLLEPLVIKDDGDSWGTECWRYRDIIGRFVLDRGSANVVEEGPVRTISESILKYNKSWIVLHTISYPSWPVLEFRLRIHWNEEQKMLKLAVPTVFRSDSVLCEVPGGAIHRPADGEERVFGRWALAEGKIKGRPTALAVIGSGQHGLDFADGEMRLSILRSAAYCHERGFPLGKSPARKYMDQGVHDLRLLVTAGDAEDVRLSLSGLADWLTAPPFALAHLPISPFREEKPALSVDEKTGLFPLLFLEPANIRMIACKPSWDGKALIVRLHESGGQKTAASLKFSSPSTVINLSFKPFEIKTVRLEKTDAWREVDLIEEK
jgi:alpha-mannosidase